MKQMKHGMTLFPALVLLATILCGCGASQSYGTEASMSAGNGSASSYSAAYDSAAEMPMEPMEPGWAEESETQSTGGRLPENVKMIYTADISMESTDFDAAAAGLEALVEENGGWFEHSQLNNSNRNYRRAYYTVRVPAENFITFCDSIGNLCQVNSINKDSQNVSEFYYDTESRLITQQTKLARLQELLAQAENMEDIITLESAISDTELAIEQLTGTLRHYDSLVGYSTITISLAEVYQLTETEAPAIGFGAKLAAAFKSGSRSFVTGLQDLMLGFARTWAGWLIFFIIVAIVVILIVRGNRRRKERGARPPKQRKLRRGKVNAAELPAEQEGNDPKQE